MYNGPCNIPVPELLGHQRRQRVLLAREHPGHAEQPRGLIYCHDVLIVIEDFHLELLDSSQVLCHPFRGDCRWTGVPESTVSTPPITLPS